MHPWVQKSIFHRFYPYGVIKELAWNHIPVKLTGVSNSQRCLGIGSRLWLLCVVREGINVKKVTKFQSYSVLQQWVHLLELWSQCDSFLLDFILLLSWWIALFGVVVFPLQTFSIDFSTSSPYHCLLFLSYLALELWSLSDFVV